MAKTLQGYREIELRLWSTSGPRHFEDGLTIRFTPSNELQIKWSDDWPEGDDYSRQVEEVIKAEIKERIDQPFGGIFDVSKISFNKIGSSPRGFETVTREMMRSFFSLGKLIDYTPPPL